MGGNVEKVGQATSATSTQQPGAKPSCPVTKKEIRLTLKVKTKFKPPEPIQDALVKLTGPNAAEKKTDKDGTVKFVLSSVGKYKIECSKEGFADSSPVEIVVREGDNSPDDILLEELIEITIIGHYSGLDKRKIPRDYWADKKREIEHVRFHHTPEKTWYPGWSEFKDMALKGKGKRKQYNIWDDVADIKRLMYKLGRLSQDKPNKVCRINIITHGSETNGPILDGTIIANNVVWKNYNKDIEDSSFDMRGGMFPDGVYFNPPHDNHPDVTLDVVKNAFYKSSKSKVVIFACNGATAKDAIVNMFELFGVSIVAFKQMIRFDFGGTYGLSFDEAETENKIKVSDFHDLDQYGIVYNSK
jgi:hypothetical protein